MDVIETEESMQAEKETIGIIGAGNMGEAIAGALIRTETFDPSSITISDIEAGRLDRLKAKYRIRCSNDNFALFDSCSIVILAVKPQQMGEVLRNIAEHPGYRISQKKLIISIAAGVTLEKIESLLYPPLDKQARRKLAIIRVMPNTPALVLKGMSAMSPNPSALPQDIELSRQILQAMGKVIQLDEKYLNAVTALSGSGPAYAFYLIESMISAGISLGIDPKDAEVMTLETIKGAVALMESQGESAETLRKKVTSPGGTTEAALRVLETKQVKQTIVEAITAAARRADELETIDKTR